jgi:hypothetical protein
MKLKEVTNFIKFILSQNILEVTIKKEDLKLKVKKEQT